MKYILLIACLICFGACTKVLDEKSDTRLVIPTTVTDLQALLDDGVTMNTRRTPSFGEASADDYFLLQTGYNALTVNAQRSYIWTNRDYLWPNDWSAIYTPVYNANLCLEQLEGIAVTNANQAAWNNIKGSALFFRAYYFLQGAWVFAQSYDAASAGSDPGIAIRTQSDPNIPSVRASVKATYDQIVTDARTSIGYLPDNAQNFQRPCKAAAYGLLARTFLTMRMYDSAYKYADLFLQAKSTLIDYNNTAQVSASGTVSFQQLNNPETIFYTEMTVNYNSIQTTSALADTTLFNSYATNDMRKTVFFRANGNYRRFKGSYAGSGTLFFSGIATDEMYLVRAECAARANNITGAMADLNALMIKRWKTGTYVNMTSSSAADALSKVLVERRKELIFRGLRWPDIKRLNKENANITLTRILNGQTYTLAPNANAFALALPSDIVNITGMPQNPQ